VKGKHNYKATWIEGKGIEVRDKKTGVVVEVSYGATEDRRTTYAYIGGVGFIGGWQYPSPPCGFKTLAAYINQGILYSAQADLPQIGGKNSRGPRQRH
jgi:hypothetical protein